MSEKKETAAVGLNAASIWQTAVHKYAMFIALIAIALFFQWCTDGVLLAPMNISKLIMQNSYILILLGFLVALYSFICNRTVFGRHIYAVGGNERAAQLSGIKTRWVRFLVFVNMGLMAAVAGLVFSARLNAAAPSAGMMFELDAIAACYIGGASASGGVGTIIGAVVGGLVMGVLNNGMSIMGVGIDWQQAIKGMVLLAAVAFDIYNQSTK
ncbi:hypothetical protein AXF19_07480 [Selenomonas sp. oral taxon 126]|uniref:ABC transporter permease subunit n=1 Tax=Selenomonas sp. oral taxon 126 TaxID=712528 RepID=UPI0008077C14|nr:hypothetical protein [Selenomonas sp. oral taxon 126]ANR70836.1 hypothetical protein AXF19_07480 [Selenomonas sp. oral taxon 126]